ncbi:rod shape-determining protein RodA [bacterium]|nr:rod shape-determining protein RodA [bacterium]
MLNGIKKEFHIDWILFAATLPLVGAGLVTMDSFSGTGYFFDRQLVWAGISIALFFVLSFIDFRFLRSTRVIISLFAAGCGILLLLFILGSVIKGAQSWFDVGIFSIQPSDPMKLIVILVLAKYFARRHIEIANIRHILVSAAYAFIPFTLVFLQPDFGSAVIIFFIWLGLVMVSGISRKHFAATALMGVVSLASLWFFVFEDYQKERILTFLNPLTDIHGAGYNALQSVVAVGSGKILGKGIGYGTQSRLAFLPEYETDFIFAAFAEEWGFVGVLAVFALFGIIIWRIVENAMRGATNFETLFSLGFAIFLISHFFVHVGMNIGLLPVTGTTIPFMSYGGSHLLTEYAGLGIIMGMRRYARAVGRHTEQNEIIAA